MYGYLVGVERRYHRIHGLGPCIITLHSVYTGLYMYATFIGASPFDGGG